MIGLRKKDIVFFCSISIVLGCAQQIPWMSHYHINQKKERQAQDMKKNILEMNICVNLTLKTIQYGYFLILQRKRGAELIVFRFGSHR